MQPIIFSLKRNSFSAIPTPFLAGLRQGFLDPFTPRWYVNPGSGTGANNGLTPADAFNSATTAWADAIAASSPGDDFYINSASTCSNASTQTLTFKGTAALPNRIFSCTFGNNPPGLTDLAAGAAFTTTGSSNITIRGYFYAYGLVFNCGTGANAASFVIADSLSLQTYDSCALKLLSTGSSATILVGNNTNSKVIWINTTATFNGGTGSGFNMNVATFIWRNTANAVQGTQSALANLFSIQISANAILLFDNVDFAGSTGIASGKNIIQAVNDPVAIQFINCLFKAGAIPAARPTGPLTIIDQIVSDTGATGYKQQRDMYQGTLTADIARYNNATDGTTPISWQVVTTANDNAQNPFECFQIVQWVAAGTYANSKIFLTSTNASLKTNDVWVDFAYLGTTYALGSAGTTLGAGTGLGTLPQLPAGSKPGALTPASPAWATGSLGCDYQLAIPSFTTSAPGFVRFTVKVAKPSFTVNIDPAVTVAA